MCPMCITTVALWIAGATSAAGGLGLLAAKTLRVRPDTKNPEPKPQPTEKQPC